TLVQLDISDVPKENQSAIIGALDDLSLDEVSLSKDGKYLSLLAPLTLECGLEDTLKKVEALKACSMLDVFCQFKPISLEEIAVKYWDGKQYFDELGQMREQKSRLETQLREQQARHEQMNQANAEKLQILEQAEVRLKQQFEHLANQLFEEKTAKVDLQNRQSLEGLLSPLKEQLEGFKKQVNDSFSQEAK
ncbi:hypothetical protein R7Z37_27125, partial [Vibrio sp. 1640]|nr:hypothetical protein [Vibrio sp. 1640]